MSDSNGHRRWPVILQPLSVPTVSGQVPVSDPRMEIGDPLSVTESAGGLEANARLRLVTPPVPRWLRLKGTMSGRVETGHLTDAELRGLARAWEADLLVYAAQCRAFRAASSR
jgi:hypothetical protein